MIGPFADLPATKLVFFCWYPISYCDTVQLQQYTYKSTSIVPTSKRTGSESVCHGNNYYCIAIRRVYRVVGRAPAALVINEKRTMHARKTVESWKKYARRL